MAIWRLGAVGEKAACEEMHLSGNQHTPCQTLFGLSLDCGDQPRWQTSRGGRNSNDTAASRKFSWAPPGEPACSCLRASFDVKPDR